MLGIILLLGACETTGSARLSGSGEHRAEQLADNGRPQDAAGVYIGLATNAAGTERDRLTLLAVEQWLDAGDLNRAERASARVQAPSSGPLLPIWNTNSAALSLYRGNADAALQLLEPLSRRSLPLRDRLRVEVLRADAWIQKQDPARAIELMEQREIWLSGSKQIEANRSRLWQGLLYSDPQVLRQAAQIATDEQIRGWLTLGSLATSTGQQGVGWSNGIFRWRTANPGSLH